MFPINTLLLIKSADSVWSEAPRYLGSTAVYLWQAETCILVTRFTADRRGTTTSVVTALMRGGPPTFAVRTVLDNERARVREAFGV